MWRSRSPCKILKLISRTSGQKSMCKLHTGDAEHAKGMAALTLAANSKISTKLCSSSKAPYCSKQKCQPSSVKTCEEAAPSDSQHNTKCRCADDFSKNLPHQLCNMVVMKAPLDFNLTLHLSASHCSQCAFGVHF